MRGLVRVAGLGVIVSVLAGCVSSGLGTGLTLVDDRGLVRGCQIASDLEAQDARYDQVMASVRVQANKVGATHVLREMEGTVPCGGGVCAMFKGVAYRCPER